MGNVIIDYTNASGNKIRFTEQKASTIPKSIEAKSLRPKVEGDIVEAKVAKYVSEETSCEVTAFGSQVKNMTKNNLAGDIDVATDKYIIEAKKSVSAIDIKQFNKYTGINDPNYLNYDGRKIGSHPKYVVII